MRVRHSGTPIERLLARIEIGEEFNGERCWIWTGSTCGGYGKISVFGKMRLVHRIAYGGLVGPIADGLHIDHLCGNTRCCNPRHLQPVTPKQNVLRSRCPSALLARRTHCPKGHPLVGGNLVPSKLKQGKRACLICCREKARQRR